MLQPTKKASRIYKSDPKDCEGCPFLSQCTKSKNQEKVITRHIKEITKKEEANHIRHTDEWKNCIHREKKQLNECLQMPRKTMG